MKISIILFFASIFWGCGDAEKSEEPAAGYSPEAQGKSPLVRSPENEKQYWTLGGPLFPRPENGATLYRIAVFLEEDGTAVLHYGEGVEKEEDSIRSVEFMPETFHKVKSTWFGAGLEILVHDYLDCKTRLGGFNPQRYCRVLQDWVSPITGAEARQTGEFRGDFVSSEENPFLTDTR